MKMHDGGWKTHASRFIFQSPWFRLRQDDITLPGGEEITYTLVDHPGYAMVVPMVDRETVLLEEVYRHTVQQTVIECPSGGLDDDQPLDAAHRELLEETGWAAAEMSPLGSYFGSNGISNERFHLFLATGLEQVAEPDREPTEQMELIQVPFDRAVHMALSGEVEDGPSAFALLLAANRLGRTITSG